MRRYRSSKIVATLGPSSSSPEMIEKLFQSGVDVFRLNFSHGTHEGHQRNYEIIRALEKKYDRPIGILQDLQGPKLRVGRFRDGKIKLETGASFLLDLKSEEGNASRVNLPHPEIFQVLESGAELLLDDGKIRLRVETCDLHSARATVTVGGELSNNKGVNLPGVRLPLSPITQKDRIDLEFGLNLGVDFVALSFVQHPDDMREARRLIADRAFLVAKLEKPSAIDHLDEIVELSDGIMIARGDLGVEMMPEDVPSIQRQIIRTCRKRGKPVIVATQMLDSMVHAPTPTRAEASDVATAVYDGVDAVMLSAESASGDFPIESVEMMNRIITRVEKDPLYRTMIDTSRTPSDPTPSDAITAAARHVAATIFANAIVTLTTSGSTTLRAARERPVAPILGLTPLINIARQLTLVWGTHPVKVDQISSFDQTIDRVCEIVLKDGFADKGDDVIITAGAQFGKENKKMFQSGTTRALRIVTVGEE